MSLIPEIHLALAIISLMFLALEDWARFEIAPQWVIVSSVNIIAFNISIGMDINAIFWGLLVLSASLAVVYGIFYALGRKNKIGVGDLYFIPTFGLVSSTDLLIPSIYLLVIVSVTFAIGVALMRGKRGRRIFFSATPAGPPFVLAMSLILIYRFIDVEYFVEPSLSASWITWIAITVFLISISATIWRVYEFINENTPNGLFPNPWDAEEDK